MKTQYFSLLIVILFVSSTFSNVGQLPLENTHTNGKNTESTFASEKDYPFQKESNKIISENFTADRSNLINRPFNSFSYDIKDNDQANNVDLTSLQENSNDYDFVRNCIPQTEYFVPVDQDSVYYYYRPNDLNVQSNTHDSPIVKIEDNKIEMIIKTGQYLDRDLFEKTLENTDTEIIKYQQSLNAYLVKVPLDRINNLQSQISGFTNFKYLEPHFYRSLSFIPNDPYWESQWGPQLIGLEDAWNISTGNRSIVVAIVDTGIDYTHPDLIDAYLPLGYDWYNNDDDPFDDYSHGTHVAGTIAASIHNNIGIAGVANVSVFVEKIFGASGGFAGDIDAAAAIEHAAAQGARIISNSWGGGGYSQLIADAVNNAVGNGSILVFSAGNGGSEYVNFPASLPNVIAVSATDVSDTLAYFSSYGKEIDVAAPGVDIISTIPGNSYESYSGTSMAAPHVSGLIALIMSQFPDYTVQQIKNLLYWSATDLGSPDFDVKYGFGRINASKTMLGLPQHDLLTNLEVNTHGYVDHPQLINATLLNHGLQTETNVNFSLFLDGAVVESVIIGSIESGAYYTLSYSWAPISVGSCNFTVYIIPVLDETFITNNIAIKIVTVVILSNYVESYPEYLWYEAQSNGYSLELSGIEVSTYLDLPFNFTFYDQNFTRVYISSNGWLSFTDTSPTVYYNPAFPTADHTYVIAPLWDDLRANNNVYAYVTSEYIVIEFVDYYSYYRSLYGTFAVVLFAYGGILFLYQDIIYHESPTVGLNLGLETSFYNTYTGSLLGLNHFAIGYNYSMPDHDLYVKINANAYTRIDRLQIINTTVTNYGLQTEISVNFSLFLDGTAVESVIIDSLESEASYILSYPWIPASTGSYNFTAYVNPVLNETDMINNRATKLVTALDLRGGFVAILNADSSDLPSYWDGGLKNDYSSLYKGLIAVGISTIIVTNDDIIAGVLTYVSVLILIDNVPNTPASSIVKDWWQAGGSILSFDSSITLLNWAGMLPVESKGSNGYSFYWDYGSSNFGILINDAHPVTSGYGYGETIIGTYGNAQYFSNRMQGTVYGEFYTPLVKSAIGGYYDYVVASDAPIGGKIVYIWDSTHWTTTSNQLMILNAINWMLIKAEHEVFAQIDVNKYTRINRSQLVNATITNYGLQTETGVNFSLFLDETMVESVIIDSLETEASFTLHYPWIPASPGLYNFTAYVIPVLNETFIINNRATQLVTVLDLHDGFVAILNADGNDLPSYWLGGLNNDYSSIYEGLIAIGISTIIITNDEIIAGVLAYVFVLILIDNVPNTLASSIVKDWWQTGGSILSFDHSIMLLNWAGMLPVESEGSNGYYTYWYSDSRSSGMLINDAHPVTAGYEYGETIYGTSYGAYYFSDIMQGTMYGEFYTPLVKSAIGSNYDYVVASDAPIGGKIVQIWDSKHWATTSNQLMILNAINWMLTRAEHDLFVRLQVNTYNKIDQPQLVNVTVINYGLQTETNVNFSLSLDGTVVKSIILDSLECGERYTLHYPWTPASTGSYNFTAYVNPVQNETYIINNRATKLVTAWDLLISDPITITSDDDFISYGFAGSGTLDDPYKIESLAITIPPIYDPAAICISGTTKHFIIKNCFIQTTKDFVGIWIESIALGTCTIINNTILNNYLGIVLWGSDAMIIISNILSNNRYGIVIVESSSNNIVKNVIRKNNYGILTQSSMDNIFIYNWIADNTGYGLAMYGGDTGNSIYFNNFINNTASSSQAYDDGINNIWYNEVLHQGNYWSDWGGEGAYPIDGDAGAVDLYPLAGYNKLGPEHDLFVQISVNTYSCIDELQNVTAKVANYGLYAETAVEFSLYLDGTIVDSVIIDNLECGARYILSYPWTPASTGSYNFTAYVNPVLNETFIINNRATKIVTVTDISTSDPIIITSDNDFISYGFAGSGSKYNPYKIDSLSITTKSPYYSAGIYVSGTTRYFIIKNCLIQTMMNSHGIFIESIAPGTCKIMNNTILNNAFGIELYNCESMTISGNTFNNNMYGIAIGFSSLNIISQNAITENTYGIGMQYSYNNSVTYNWLIDNQYYGFVNFGHSTGNSIYFNNFIHNGNSTSQAYDDGIDNIWYNEKLHKGNYWSDWDGEGAYSIAGSAGAVDLYPLCEFSDLGPIISSVQFLPVTPSDQDRITITATVTDIIGITNVTLIYRVNEGEWQSIMMSANKSIYSAAIGPFGFDDNIEFYLNATNTMSKRISCEPMSFIVADGTDPIISNVQYLPISPTDRDRIMITAIVTDNDAVANVTVVYRVNGGEWQTSVMTDNGSTYSVTIGAFSRNSLVEFFIDAKDSANNENVSETYSFTTTPYSPIKEILGISSLILLCTAIMIVGILLWKKKIAMRT